MFLIVEMGGSDEPSYLEFEATDRAQSALADFQRADGDVVVDFRNEWGEVLAVRRTAVRRIWTSEAPPDQDRRIVARVEDLLILLGEPVYHGPKRVDWHMPLAPDEVQSPTARQMIVWSCGDPPERGGAWCIAEFDDPRKAVYRPCRFHRTPMRDH